MEKRKAKKNKKRIAKKSMREASLQEIGDELGLTRMRICQIEKILLQKIRESGSFEEFK